MIDRAFGRLERLPWSGVPLIILVALVLGLLAHVPSWVRGELPVGAFLIDAFSPVAYLAYFLCLIVVLDGIARSSFDAFRPALALPAEDADRLRAQVTSIPGRPAAVGMLISGVVMFIGFGLDPGTNSNSGALPPILSISEDALWLITILAIGLVVVHTLLQLRLVEHLHAQATNIDLLQTGPIHAFSRLTAATAVGVLIIAILFAAPETNGVSTFGILAGLVFVGLAIATFGLPLAGMHDRLVHEKAELMDDVNSRLKVVLARIHATVDADDLGRADGLQKTQTALLAERDLYSHLSTWPWSAGTFRGLATAVLIPITIGIILRLVTHVV